MTTITLDGKHYTVSDLFASKVATVLGTLSFGMTDVESHIKALMLVSNRRQLSDRERLVLDYLTHVRNVHNAIQVVGEHHDPVAEWGLDGWDAVHGNSYHRPCGCEEHHVFDHHGASNHFGHNRVTENLVLHPIEPRRVCKDHAHLQNDPHALKKALEGDKH